MRRWRRKLPLPIKWDAGGDQVHLVLRAGVGVSVSRTAALSATASDFADLYRDTVYGSTRLSAEQWGEEQVKTRAAAYRIIAQACL